MTAPAIYLGLQPGFRHIPPIELYNLLAPVGEHPAGSTVSRQTLEKYGYSLPLNRRPRRHRRSMRRILMGACSATLFPNS